jgi:hypothetical protein
MAGDKLVFQHGRSGSPSASKSFFHTREVFARGLTIFKSQSPSVRFLRSE